MKISKKTLFKFYFSFQRKYFFIAVITAVLLLVSVLLQLPMPLVTRYLIDTIIPSRDFHAVNLLCLLLLASIILRQIIGYTMQYSISKYKAKVRYDLEQALYLHIQDLPLGFFTQKDTGYIMSRISEISAVESILADTFLYILRDVITIIVGSVMILKLHLKLGLVSLFLLPFFVLTLKTFHKKIKLINKELREKSAQYSGKLEKNIQAIEKIKSSGKEEIEGKRTSQKLFQVIETARRSEMLSALGSIASSFVGMIAPFVILWYGVTEIIKGTLSLGTFFAINAFLGYLYNPAKQLTDTGYMLSRSLAGLERVYEIFQEQKEEKGTEPIDSITSIEFQNVSFDYSEKDPVLTGLNLKIGKGEKIAIVGESGEGKSTIVKMIMKFYMPKSGQVLISGKESSQIDIKSLRQRIMYVAQRPYLLEEDLEELIKNDRVKELLQRIRFDKNSIDTPGNVKQKQFSGGELQKIELLEAILAEPDVLIIDEGTSNLDFNSENIILTELYEKYKDRTILFIAHRLTSIAGFDRIIVIQDGKISEDGTHEELLKARGKYYSFWQTGTRKEENMKGEL